MTLLEQIAPKIIAAMKAKDELTLNTLRGIKMALDRWVKEVVTPITPEVEQKILEKMVKQRLDSIDQYEKGNRADLVAREQAELAVLRLYMPQDASVDEIEAAVAETIADLLKSPDMGFTPGSISKKIGPVIAGVKTRLAGKRVDGKLLADIVKAKIA